MKCELIGCENKAICRVYEKDTGKKVAVCKEHKKDVNTKIKIKGKADIIINNVSQ